MTPKSENPIETNNFTLTFTGEQLRVLSKMAHSVVIDKIARWDDLDNLQQFDLGSAMNLIQKQLDFPNLKF